jgi:hypothetical protein
MAKRIVEDLYENGTVRYRVETNDGIFGWFYKKFNIWYTDSFRDYEIDMEFYAIFDTLNEARVFCGPKHIPIIESKIIEVYE